MVDDAIPAHELHTLWRDDNLDRRILIWELMHERSPRVIINEEEYRLFDHRLQENVFHYGRIFKKYDYGHDQRITQMERGRAETYADNALKYLYEIIDEPIECLVIKAENVRSIKYEKEARETLRLVGFVFANEEIYGSHAKLQTWTQEEACILLLGFSPKHFLSVIEKLKQGFESSSLLMGALNNFPEAKRRGEHVESLISDLEDLYKLIERNAVARGFGQSRLQAIEIYPSCLIEWCDQVDIDVPDKLRTLVDRYSSLPNLKEKNERLRSENVILKEEGLVGLEREKQRSTKEWCENWVLGELEKSPDKNSHGNNDRLKKAMQTALADKDNDAPKITDSIFRDAKAGAIEKDSRKLGIDQDNHPWAKPGLKKKSS